jgi:O-antigen/teichoic acid export membrane protein
MSHLTLVKNAIANLARGSIGALIALAMPPFLTRALSKDTYGTWLLILQLATYVSFLDFGIQTAVGRFVAHANEIGDKKQRDSIVSTSLAILTVSGLVSILGIMLLVLFLPNLFPQMPVYLQQEAQLALMYVGGSLAIGLPFSVFNGIFIGLQRYDIPALIVGTSKLLGAVFVILVAHSTHSIISMAMVMAISNLLGYLWQWFAYRQIAGEIRLSKDLISKTEGKNILDYCFNLMVWSFGMLLVSGFDTAIVGYNDYKSVAYYAVAASLITFIIGLQGSLFSVLMPNAAVLSARGESDQLGEILLRTTRYGSLILLSTGLPTVIFAKEILTVWVGNDYGNSGASILQILVVANIIRLTSVPYVTMILGVGQQNLITMSPIIESFSNLSISIVLASYLGGVGVAIGTLFGSLISIVGHIFYNMSRTNKITFIRHKYLTQCILKPFLCFIPLILYGYFRFLWGQGFYDILLGVSSILMTIRLVTLLTISSSERKQIWLIIDKII